MGFARSEKLKRRWDSSRRREGAKKVERERGVDKFPNIPLDGWTRYHGKSMSWLKDFPRQSYHGNLRNLLNTKDLAHKDLGLALLKLILVWQGQILGSTHWDMRRYIVIDG